VNFFCDPEHCRTHGRSNVTSIVSRRNHCEISRSKVISISLEGYRPNRQTDRLTQPANWSARTTEWSEKTETISSSSSSSRPVRSVVWVGSTDTEANDEKRLQAFHMKAQRRILQISWYNFITSDSIGDQTELADIPLIIADRRHAILGHIIRLPEETPAHTVLQHVMNITNGSRLAAGWKRPPRRPRKTRLQQVIVDQDCDIDMIWSQASDHSTWRSLPLLVRRSSECVVGLVYIVSVIVCVGHSNSNRCNWSDKHPAHTDSGTTTVAV